MRKAPKPASPALCMVCKAISSGSVGIKVRRGAAKVARRARGQQAPDPKINAPAQDELRLVLPVNQLQRRGQERSQKEPLLPLQEEMVGARQLE